MRDDADTHGAVALPLVRRRWVRVGPNCLPLSAHELVDREERLLEAEVVLHKNVSQT